MSKLEKIFSGKILIILFLLYIVTAFFLYYLPQPIQILDTMFFYTSRQLNALLNTYTKQDIAYYLSTMRLDFVYPLVYGALLFVMINFLRQKLNYYKIQVWTFLPLVAVFFDYAENICIRHILKHRLAVETLPCSITGVFTLIKWSFVFVNIAVIIFLFVKFLFKRVSKI